MGFPQSSQESCLWCLEGLDDHHRLVRVPLHSYPFRIGRLPGLELTLLSERISKLQAEIDKQGERLVIRDLGSTNGTFVNRVRVHNQVELQDTDILHFGDQEFQIGRLEGEAMRLMTEKTANIPLDLPTSMLKRRRRLRELLDNEAIEVVYQSIWTVSGSEVYAHEALTRGCMEGLPRSPAALLKLASDIGQSIALSRLMNLLSIERYRDAGRLFINVHPDDLQQPGFLTHFQQLRGRAGQVELILEIPETAITDPSALRELQTKLDEMGVEMAYDDFGAGRSRMLELVEVPPHYLKFDRRMIDGLDADLPRQRLVSALLEITKDLGIVAIAEGVETSHDASACQELGFDYCQGYYYSKPGALD